MLIQEKIYFRNFIDVLVHAVSEQYMYYLYYMII